MKKIFLLLLLFITALHSQSLDTNVFKYFPLNIGNKWISYVFRNFIPGSGYESLIIVSTLPANSHLYYKFRRDEYIIYTNQHDTSNLYFRIDSLTGNIYKYNIQTNTECFFDSLNSRKNDSARVTCEIAHWCRYDTASYSIFSQNYHTKISSWVIPVEVSGQRKYSKNIGRVFERNQALMSYSEITLRGCLISGILYGDTTFPVGINQINSEVPQKFSLFQNYPNPFNPSAKINFEIPKSGFVKLTVFDVLGREIQVLVNQQLSAGTYEAGFDGSNLPSGVYYYKLETELFTETKKMILVK